MSQMDRFAASSLIVRWAARLEISLEEIETYLFVDVDCCGFRPCRVR